MNLNLLLLTTSRAVRKQLLASRLYSGASIRDAVELAADNIRQIADEERSSWLAKSRRH